MANIKKGDTVQVITGEAAGVRGVVHRIDAKNERVVVAGANLVKKHQKPTGNKRTQVGIIEFEAPIHLSNVMIVCPHCNELTRVSYEIDPDGHKTRVCKNGDRLDS